MKRTAAEAWKLACPYKPNETCDACGCMMWRWADSEREVVTADPGKDGNGPWEYEKYHACNLEYWRRPYGERRRGYCGLAGRVE